MTVHVAITGRVASGKLNEATAYLGKFVETIKSITGNDVQVLGEVGEINSVRTVQTFDSLANLEKAIDDCWGNEGYRKLMDSAEGLFTDGDTRVWKATS